MYLITCYLPSVGGKQNNLTTKGTLQEARAHCYEVATEADDNTAVWFFIYKQGRLVDTITC